MAVSYTAAMVLAGDCRAAAEAPSRLVAPRTVGAVAEEAHGLVAGEADLPLAAVLPLLLLKLPLVGDRSYWRSGAGAEAADSRIAEANSALAWVPVVAVREYSAAAAAAGWGSLLDPAAAVAGAVAAAAAEEACRLAAVVRNGRDPCWDRCGSGHTQDANAVAAGERSPP